MGDILLRRQAHVQQASSMMRVCEWEEMGEK
jgi:hypothetical protein